MPATTSITPAARPRKIPTQYQADALLAIVQTGSPVVREGFSWYCKRPGGGLDRAAGDTRTITSCAKQGWLVACGGAESALPRDRHYTITPEGRDALSRICPNVRVVWSDSDRILFKSRDERGGFIGPIEAGECGEHLGQYYTFRWAWDPGRSDDHLTALQLCGEVEPVRGCPTCAAERAAQTAPAYARAYLTFTMGKIAALMKVSPTHLTPAKIRAHLHGASRRDLARAASGVHGERDDAIAYAQSEGPAVVLFPDGTVRVIGRKRDAQLDAAAARDEDAHAIAMNRARMDDTSAAPRRHF